jgi:transposase
MKQSKSKIKANTVRVDERNIVGIDIGKRKHAATAVSPQGVTIASFKLFENNRSGVDQLERHVLIPATTPHKPMIAMEATGQYWNALHDELQRRGYSCVVLNPIQTSSRGKKQIRKTKTDLVDSGLIARTILSGDARWTIVPDEAMFELRLLVRHRWRLIRTHGIILRYAISLLDRVFPEFEGIFCKPFLSSIRQLIREIGITPCSLIGNREKVPTVLERASRKMFSKEKIDLLLNRAAESIGTQQGDQTVNHQFRMIVDYLDFVEKQVKEVNEELRKRMAETPSPITSLGIGPELAATILAESGDVTMFAGPEKYSAFCGLDPSEYKSGDRIKGRTPISKRGSPLLRWAMYMSAVTVCKKHHDFNRIFERHAHKGYRYAMVAVAHKLARVIWRLMKDNRKFTKRPPKRTV